ncbi:MAG: EI24 domain-containing protein [Planctomycetia bacterium]|nr:EI24 domain-containing protein [Planctomycetia bacterium]
MMARGPGSDPAWKDNALRDCRVATRPAAWAAFREGFAAPWVGFRYMRSRPALWRYGILPVLLNLLVTAFVLAVLVAATVYLFTILHPRFGDGWAWLVAEVLAAAGLLVVVIALAAVAWVVLQGIFCGHFYGKLAEQVERQLGLRPEEIRDVPFSHQVVDTLRDVGFLGGVNLGCLAIQIIPGLGSVVGLAGSYYFSCSTLGRDYFDHPMSLRGMRRREKLQFARRHRAHVLGLGTAVALVTLVPIVNAVLLTTAVTGAVLLHRRLAGSAPTRGHSSPRLLWAKYSIE